MAVPSCRVLWTVRNANRTRKQFPFLTPHVSGYIIDYGKAKACRRRGRRLGPYFRLLLVLSRSGKRLMRSQQPTLESVSSAGREPALGAARAPADLSESHELHLDSHLRELVRLRSFLRSICATFSEADFPARER